MSPRLKRILAWVGYPLFYLLVLLLFTYVTFPYDRVKDRIVAEYNATQPTDGMRLEIDDLDGYWLSGVEVEGVRLVGPKPEPDAEGKTPPRKEIEIAEAHARASILRWIIGVTHVAFAATAFDGELEGVYAKDGEGVTGNIELDAVDVGKMPYVIDVLGLPMKGAMSGTMEMVVPEGKYAKADGKIDITISGLEVGDGKAKVLDTIALPRLRAGEVVLQAESTAGRFKIDKFEAKGPDFELIADGKIRLRDPVKSSVAELNLRFKFTDAYKSKNDLTKALFGDGGKGPALFEMHPKVKRAKRSDGFYGWRLAGPLSKLDFQPAAMAAGRPGRSTRRPMRGFTPPKSKKKK